MHDAVLSAVLWPVALFVAIEILSRTTSPAGMAWRIVRLGGLLPVAVVARRGLLPTPVRPYPLLRRGRPDRDLRPARSRRSDDCRLGGAVGVLIVASERRSVACRGGRDTIERSHCRSRLGRRPSDAASARGRDGRGRCAGQGRHPIAYPPVSARRGPRLRAGRARGRSQSIGCGGGTALQTEQPLGTARRPRGLGGSQQDNHCGRRLVHDPSPVERSQPSLDRSTQSRGIDRRSLSGQRTVHFGLLRTSRQDRQAHVQRNTPRHCNLTGLRRDPAPAEFKRRRDVHDLLVVRPLGGVPDGCCGPGPGELLHRSGSSRRAAGEPPG
jgi:hypothetical protein